MAECIHHRALFLVRRKRLQHTRIQQDSLRDDAFAGNGLFCVIEVNHGVAGRFAAGPGGRRDGQERNLVRDDCLLKVVPGVIHVAEELDALCHVQGRTAAQSDDGGAIVPQENLYPGHDAFVERIRLEIAEANKLDSHAFNPLEMSGDVLQKPYGFVADEQDRFCAGPFNPRVKSGITVFRCDNRLRHGGDHSSGIRLMISLMLMHLSSHSFAR